MFDPFFISGRGENGQTSDQRSMPSVAPFSPRDNLRCPRECSRPSPQVSWALGMGQRMHNRQKSLLFQELTLLLQPCSFSPIVFQIFPSSRLCSLNCSPPISRPGSLILASTSSNRYSGYNFLSEHEGQHEPQTLYKLFR